MGQTDDVDVLCMYCGKSPANHPDWGHKPTYLPEPGRLPYWSRLHPYDGAAVTKPSTVVFRPVQR